MSAAAAQTADAGIAPAAKGKKKLLVIVAAALLVVLAGGGAAVFYLKKQAAAAAAAAEAEDDEGIVAAKPAKGDAPVLPTFLPLEPGLRPFGYDLFRQSRQRFQPSAFDVPVPADYVIGPGDTINVQWTATASFLAEPYKGADAYETKDGLMWAQVTTFDGAQIKLKK